MLKELCYIKNVDGVQLLFMPDGTEVPGIQMTRVKQDSDDVWGGKKRATALVQFIVNIKS